MVRTQIQLTDRQAREVRRIARARHVSVARIIRDAVENVIRSGAWTGTEERRKRAVRAVGQFRSGKRYISREHDKYLVEAFRK